MSDGVVDNLDNIGPETLASQRALIFSQAKLEMDDQAARAREFEVQVKRAYRAADRADKLAKGYTQITRAELTRMQRRWLGSSSMPGRILPHLYFGPGWKSDPRYVPIEHRAVYSNVQSLRP